MAFTLASNYDHRAYICYATFDGVLVEEAEVAQVFALLGEHIRRLPRPVYLIANCEAWRVDTAVMRTYGHALRAFCTDHKVCFASYSADIYARMNLRLAAVIGGANSNLFPTPAEAVQFIQDQQQAAMLQQPPGHPATLPRAHDYR